MPLKQEALKKVNEEVEAEKKKLAELVGESSTTSLPDVADMMSEKGKVCVTHVSPNDSALTAIAIFPR